MTVSKGSIKIKSDIREYLAHMSELGREPTHIYLTSKQIDTLKKQAERDKVKWVPVIDGYPIKVWNP